MKFAEFIKAYNTGDIVKDATWRSYDIPGMVNSITILKALKYLRYSGNPNMSIGKLASDYQIDTFERAKYLVEIWFTWREIAIGARTRKLIMRKGSNND